MNSSVPHLSQVGLPTYSDSAVGDACPEMGMV